MSRPVFLPKHPYPEEENPLERDDVRYLVFDIESVADGDLVAKLRYGDDAVSPREAVARYRAELIQRYDNDFIPYTFQIPV